MNWRPRRNACRLRSMTNASERFRPDQLNAAIAKASTADSLKVIINWD